ncbi:hypothetical protein GCM10027592_55630 [Spirosoma flavus]
MNIKTAFLILIWAVFFVLALDFGYELLNQKDTLQNIGGFLVVGAVLIISLTTRCFTVNPFKR